MNISKTLLSLLSGPCGYISPVFRRLFLFQAQNELSKGFFCPGFMYQCLFVWLFNDY